MADSWEWGDLGADEVAPRVTTVDLVVPTTAQRQRLDELAAALDAARQDDSIAGGNAAEVREEIAAIEAEATRTFTVRSVGYRRWRELIEEHPTEDRMQRWDPAKFIPAAILECCDQFKTAKQVEQAGEVLAHGQIIKLFAAIRQTNEGDDPVPTVRGR